MAKIRCIVRPEVHRQAPKQHAPATRRAQAYAVLHATAGSTRHINCPAVEPITVSATISRPREEVFEYLADIANHAEFTDHYLVDWRLTREDSYGRGAGARFRIKAPLNRFGWADMTLAELQPPFRIVERGRGGKFNRIKMLGVYELSPGAGGSTRVTYTFETEPVLPSDRLMEVLGGRSWTRRKTGRAMRRLRSILEDDRGRGHHVSVSAR